MTPRILAFCLFACGLRAAEPVPYWVATCPEKETACDASDGELAAWALQAWERASEGSLRLQRVNRPEEALIRVYWVTDRDGLYGEARPFRQGDRVGAELHIRPDLRGLGPDIASRGAEDRLFRDTIVYLTCLHESGHALGLSHTSAFDDIMYSFGFGGDILAYFMRYRQRLSGRQDIPKQDGLSPVDRRRLRGALAR